MECGGSRILLLHFRVANLLQNLMFLHVVYNKKSPGYMHDNVTVLVVLPARLKLFFVELV